MYTSDCADVSDAWELKLSWDGVGDTLLAVKESEKWNLKSQQPRKRKE